jgi:hypothetical protein
MRVSAVSPRGSMLTSQIVLGEIFGRQFGQAFVVFDEQYACIHPAILTAGRSPVQSAALAVLKSGIFAVEARAGMP